MTLTLRIAPFLWLMLYIVLIDSRIYSIGLLTGSVCIVEAMKLMNEIESEVSGKITEICVEDGQSVEYGQVLMYVE